MLLSLIAALAAAGAESANALANATAMTLRRIEALLERWGDDLRGMWGGSAQGSVQNLPGEAAEDQGFRCDRFDGGIGRGSLPPRGSRVERGA